MIKFHPTNQALVGFAEGSVSPSESVLIAAHCEMCVKCASKVSTFAELAAERVFEDESSIASNLDNEMSNMLDAIVSRPAVKIKSAVVSRSPTLSINGIHFKIPPSLQRFSANANEWTHLVGKLWQAPVSIGGKNLANFIYMEKGGSVPEHTHIGKELTLVINGSFSDGMSRYRTGDYIELGQSHTHAPNADSDEGCLVFSIIDEPLHFTSGWSRLINPLSHLYFKVSTKE